MVYLRGHRQKWGWPNETETGGHKNGAHDGNDFRGAETVAQPAESGGGDRIRAAVYNEHKTDNDGREVELTQMGLQSGLQESNGHTRDDYTAGG